MPYLQHTFWGNTFGNYLSVGMVILVAIGIKRYLSRYIASLLYSMIRRASGNIDKNLFIDLVVSPLEIFLVVLITVLALDRLYFPDEMLLQVYHVTTRDIIESILLGVLIITFVNVLIRFLDFIAVVAGHRKKLLTQSDNQLIYFFKDFLKVLIVLTGVLLILKFCFHSHIGQLITGLSIVGAALALAAKESLENLIASFIIFFDKPFKAGDLVRLNNYQGNIERIGLRSTRLRTGDNTMVIVPNKQMVDSILDNWSMRQNIRAEIRVELSAQTTTDKVQLSIDNLKAIFNSKLNLVSSFNIFLADITANGIIIIAEYFLKADLPLGDQRTLRQDLNLEIRAFHEKNDIHSSATNTFTFIKPEDKV